MFRKNSAFSTEPEVTQRLDQIRQATAANAPDTGQSVTAQGTQKAAAYHLLTAAELMLESEDTAAAARLIAEAKEELDSAS